jgi:ABC-2 family transporter
MTEEPTPETPMSAPPSGPSDGASPRRRRGLFDAPVLRDLRHFSLRRTATIAHLAVGEAMRLRVLVVIAVGLLAIIVADLTSKRFDPVLELAPSLIRISETVIFTVGLVFAVFLSTYSIPRELASKTIYSLVTKPVSRLELVLGKTLGVIAVLGIVTLGLGLLSLGYMTVRGHQVRSLAANRYAEWADDAPATRLPTDVPPEMLKAIAEGKALTAVTYQPPTSPVTIASTRRDPGWDKNLVALSGRPTHTAHWGFENLPTEVVDGGKARVHLRVALSTKAPLKDRDREVFVRLFIEGGGARTIPAAAYVLTPDGELELSIPAKGKTAAPDYAGQRFWVSVCGIRTPMAVGPGDCWILRGDGTAVAARVGPKVTGLFELGKFLVGGSRSLGLLQAHAQFEDIPADHIGSDGTVLRLALSVGGMTTVPRAARTRVITIARHDDGTSQRREFTFRPERRTTVHIPLSRDYFAGGSLSVYLQSDVEVRLTDESIRLQVIRHSFAANWLKHLLLAWMTFAVLAAIGILFSTISGWQIASLSTGVMLLVAYFWPTTVANVRRYGVSLTGTTHSRGDVFQTVVRHVYDGVFGFLGAVLPDFSHFDRGSDVARGIDIPWMEGLLTFPQGPVWYALLYIGGTVAVAYLLFLRKEVAA